MPQPQHDYAAILQVILRQYQLPPKGDHGVEHWARVWTNGHVVGEKTGADLEVVSLFALFHDACRRNEYRDPGHGQRGGELAHQLRGKHVHLDDQRFELLYEACRLHTDGLTIGDPTLLACWDADRLDLGRVGITPDPDRLGSAPARELISWAHHRAITGHAPAEILQLWSTP
ncbi:MAG: hypothetical protein ACK493_03915 [Planctomycetota bacterium]|jgi:uncharacterized protein|nr:hypothetical protein [Blastopirellula sp.]